MHETFWKPAPGTAWLKRKEDQAKADAHEDREMRAAKRRDEMKCRRPRCEFMAKKPRIEACHQKHEHRGMGGNPKGDRTERKKIITFCFIHHRMYDQGLLDARPLTPELFDGPCEYYEQQQETGAMDHIGTETRIGVSVARS